MELLKQCSRCEKFLFESLYSKDRGKKDGRMPYCSHCNNVRRRAKWSMEKEKHSKARRTPEHRTKQNKLAASWREKNYEMWLCSKARGRARNLGIPYNLDSLDIVIPSHCPILGIPIGRQVGGFNDSSPSLDRIIPELGYIKGNICVVSFRANRLKADGTLEELEKLVNWLKEKVHGNQLS